MLDRARRRTDIEWVSGAAADAAWDRELDLATMTSNAFQCLGTDEKLRSSLAAIRRSLRDGWRFVFGTRHPPARAWEGWRPPNAVDIEDGPQSGVRHHRAPALTPGRQSRVVRSRRASSTARWKVGYA